MRSPFPRAFLVAPFLLVPAVVSAVAPGAVPVPLTPRPPGPAGIETAGTPALARLAEGPARLELDPGTGALVSLLGRLAPPEPGPPAARAARFLAEVLGLPEGSGLEVERVLTSGTGTHVEFVHRVEGDRVLSESVAVHLDPRGAVYAVEGSYRPADPGRVPAVAAGPDPVAAVRAHLGVRREAAPPAVERVRVRRDGLLVPAYEVRLASEAPRGDFAVVVDARDGRVLHGEDRLLYAHRDPPALVEGRGRVYARHPLLGEPVDAPLPRLRADQDGLTGWTAQVLNEDAPAATSPDRTFVYPPDDTHFDEVMVYHHLDRMHRFFEDLGYQGRTQPLPATVHYGDGYDNAFFSPFRDVLAFGDGTDFNDLAREDDVVYHEYTHAAVQKVVLLFGYQAGGMNEAYADYFACSLTGDPRIGVWVAAKKGAPHIRTMENTAHYPEDFTNQPHKDGMIFGGALWDLRKVLGRETTDRTVFESWYLIGSRPSFRRGLWATLAADQALTGGAHAAAITKAFGDRGIDLQTPSPRERVRRARLFARPALD